MAAANLDTNKVSGVLNTVNNGTLTAFDATDGAEYTVDNADNETMLVIVNTDSVNAETVTIKAPSNPALGAGTANKDVAVSVGAGKVGVVMIESMRYMDAVSKKVKLTGSADVKGLLIEM